MGDPDGNQIWGGALPGIVIVRINGAFVLDFPCADTFGGPRVPGDRLLSRKGLPDMGDWYRLIRKVTIYGIPRSVPMFAQICGCVQGIPEETRLRCRLLALHSCPVTANGSFLAAAG